MSIEVKALRKHYGAQKAVDGISFSVQPGQIVGFLGPNGAGKSTTMKMITGYLEPDAGTALVSGIDVRKDALAAKKKIGYLPESNALYYDLYVREYLGFMADVHGIARKKERVEEVIALTGLTPEAHKRVGQLSKGYKQRVGLAAALIHDPEVLILDEPTSGLDPNQIIEIRNVIREQGKNKLVLFSSHILQEVEAICDRVIIINKGTIVADDTLAALRSRNTMNTVRVSFQEALEPEWLRRLPAVAEVEKIDARTWNLRTEDPETVRKALLQLSVEQGLNIESLSTGSESLETIFRGLTA
ncbi:gliding motility-associated ABC transporter ATP-binding subunit GldA [Flaviaesturariibacter flavus]|uniref:Gliding motility-associated ABC transporter ATP-binding subunit GldA n=1 Tax=Flaviaesturariibacter flavus TaxID=2502780 RepID=A0A4R1BN22_9BACT|nr:gliding motility-associated ABC transporter ATP-binding subunit GldA [Flaviaesturariibacter flavus]TCJ18756.1 gliding motility-associated ABC transporter ATP-binding subunit GldA [Flaviaesturariibacter flavus]